MQRQSITQQLYKNTQSDQCSVRCNLRKVAQILRH